MLYIEANNCRYSGNLYVDNLHKSIKTANISDWFGMRVQILSLL